MLVEHLSHQQNSKQIHVTNSNISYPCIMCKVNGNNLHSTVSMAMKPQNNFYMYYIPNYVREQLLGNCYYHTNIQVEDHEYDHNINHQLLLLPWSQ